MSSLSKEEIIRTWESKDGEHKYLEDVTGDEAINWVKERNKHCLDILGNPKEESSSSHNLCQSILSILDSKDKIPHITKYGEYYYNFWQDENHSRGLYRRTTFESYKSATPGWETVLDIDDLGRKEGESWVYKGINVYQPDDLFIAPTRALVSLSRGGADATVVREFDLVSKTFVHDEAAFYLPEAKSSVAWVSSDILLVRLLYHLAAVIASQHIPCL
jgi:prolyl oligopeptidase